MVDALLERASSRFLFVVGKGGVGKSTTAGALALQLADHARAVHLISTDPAHSLGDLFRQPLPGGQAVPSLCNERLTLEEFDAPTHANQFFRGLRAPLSELIERGTYLDSADAAGFLDLSVPGIDEIMAVMRLVELLDSPAQQIVVDTAPTGHTLRLLEASRVIDSWMAAGRALAAKANAVASALVGQSLRMRAETLLDEWRLNVGRFDDSVLPAASAIVLTRPGMVVSEETRRLTAQLHQRGVRVAAVVSVGAAAEHSDFVVDWVSDVRGCAGLRTWRSHLHSSSARAADAGPLAEPVRSPAPSGESFVQSLPERILWIAGKGGVGKSTCAASIALTLADARRVCLISTDPAGSLSDVFGCPLGSATAPQLFLHQIDAGAEFARMRHAYRASVDEVFEALGLQYTLQLDRQVIESLWDLAPPGIDEIISLVEIVEHAPEFDTLIIDSAPTGHFLRLLEMPQIALDWIHALMRLLLKYGATASLDALARNLLAFAKRLRQLQSDLSTPGTAAVLIVTLDEPLVRAETTRLSTALAAAGVAVAATIVNRVDESERSTSEGAAPGSATRPQIRAPNLRHEIVGPTALRHFISQWELIG